MDLVLSRLTATPDDAPVEIVERKGIGHPDTICDALAERVSVALCRAYRERFGTILHHNVDKALLRGGASRPAFGGGEVVAPIEIYLAGRATEELGGVAVPVAEVADAACRSWLGETLHALDVDRQVRLRILTRPGSSDLRDLYDRARGASWLANDTSIGVGVAPPTALERIVPAVADVLAAQPGTRPEVGEDVKVMAVRRSESVALTVACAFVDRFVADEADYAAKKAWVAERARDAAQPLAAGSVDVVVNPADRPEDGGIYLTVTGTSAESGDDGQVGRGNRATGLITPHRPMSLEAVAGKNPVTHVGKLYNLVALRVAAALVDSLPSVLAAECYLVSRIGRPVLDPQVADVRVKTARPGSLDALRGPVEAVIREHLADLPGLLEEILSGRVRAF